MYTVHALHEADLALASLPSVVSLADDDLLTAAAELESLGRRLDGLRTSVATEISLRSDRELGHAGLAARLGHRTPAALVTAVTRVTGRAADSRTRLGLSLGRPEFAAVTEAMRSGTIDVDAAAAIANSLTPVIGRADEAVLLTSISALVNLAATAPADTVARAARATRIRLDSQGAERREAELYAQRSVRFGRPVDGLVPMRALLPPEEAAIVRALFDSRTSTRRVSFAPGSQTSPTIDDRTMDQRRADTLIDICRIAAASLGAEAGDTPLARGVGTIVVTMTLDDLLTGAGAAHADGADEPLSAGAARRLACNAGILPVVLGSDSQPLDLGRSRRLFSAGQRRALGLRDQGCAVDDCDAPPGWTEAHHIQPWSRGGPTDLSNGVLLCSFHHHQVHDGRMDVTVHNGVPVISRRHNTVAREESAYGAPELVLT